MENNTSLVPPPKTAAEKTKRNHFWGIFLLVFPYPGMILVLFIYTIMSFVAASAVNSGEGSFLVGQVVKVILQFLGLICMAGIPIGIPLGIYLLVKKVPEDKKPE